MKNKRGSGSLFIAIILSALVLVEGLYLAQIVDINRRITIDRALKLQIETILNMYNEELFDNYGIYGFMLDDVDDEIFKKVINSTGYEYGEDIYVNGVKTINTEQIREAISVYYAYRSPGIMIDKITSIFDFAFKKLDENDFFKNLKRFKANGGNKALGLLSRASNVISKLLTSDEVAELIDITGSDIKFFNDFIDLFREANSKNLDFDDDFSPKDMFSMEFFNKTVDMFDSYSDFIDEDIFNIFLTHYGVYNFECHVKEFEKDGKNIPDKNLHGTTFKSLNRMPCDDVEYIVSGFKDGRGTFEVGYMIFPMVMLVEIVNKFSDKSFMKVVKTISEIISDVLMFILDGLKIPTWVFELIIVQYYAFFASIGKLYDLYHGETVKVFKIKNAKAPLDAGIDMNYKDFTYFFALLVNQNTKLGRIEDLIIDKYGEFNTGIELMTTYRGDTYTAEMGYELYGF